MLKQTVLFMGVMLTSYMTFAANTSVFMQTNLGDIEIELFDDEAPITVQNFKKYVEQGYYSDTIFHRVIKNFMIQGGGFNAQMTQKAPLYEPIINESLRNQLKNDYGTIAMARTADPHSATSQFYINVKDNAGLDAGHTTAGYAVFGRVTQGMDIVEYISKLPTAIQNGHQNVPKETVKILEIKIKENKSKK